MDQDGARLTLQLTIPLVQELEEFLAQRPRIEQTLRGQVSNECNNDHIVQVRRSWRTVAPVGAQLALR